MKPIICLGFTPWKGNYAKSTVQILSRLSLSTSVLYIDYQYTIKDVLTNLFQKNPIEKKRIFGVKKRLRTEKVEGYGEISVLTLPPVLPINWISNTKIFDALLKLNARIISKSIRKAMIELNCVDGIVVNAYNPMYGMALSSLFRHNQVIYYCYDEISGSPWADRHGARLENKFFHEVDKVITTSESLCIAKSRFHSDVNVVKNGVDFAFFNAHRREIKNDKPVIGYVGSLDERIDYELISDAASNLPHVDFILIGRVVFPDLIKPILNIDNIKIVGPVSYDRLPEEVNKFDVGIIPFLITKFTANIYPLKINEYLALGKPVVRTNFSNLKEFESVIYTSNTKNNFIENLDLALKEHSNKLEDRRIEIASTNSWDSRVQKFSEIIFT